MIRATVDRRRDNRSSSAAWRLLVTAIALTACGCRVLYNLDRTMHVEPHGYHNFVEEYLARRRFRRMARAMLREQGYQVRGLHQKLEGYPHGFEDGFVDYLMAGGDGLPPPIPPHKYWGHRYQTFEGRRIVDAWFAGFHDGAQAACQTGLRRLITVPSSLYLAGSELPYSIESEPTVAIDPYEELDPFEEPDAAAEEPPEMGEAASENEPLPQPARDSP